jgi:thiol-disulfide isomerase/thioredoxin
VNAPRRPAAVVLIAVGILLGAGVAGFFLYRLTTSQRPTLPAVPPPAVSPGTSAGPGAEQRTIPEELPDFSLPDTAGVPHRLADWRGRPLVVNFWATWCEPCRREIPLLEAIRRENASNSIEVVGIAVDHLDSVRKLAKELRIEYPVLVGEKGGLEAVAAFGMDTVLPFTVFADAEGRIVTLKIGELHRDEAAFILARLADLRAGRLSLAAAQEQIGDGMRRLAVSRAAAGD